MTLVHEPERVRSRLSAITTQSSGSAERVLSLPVLARRLRLSEPSVERMLMESELDGIVERAEGGWRLTSDAERRYGACLRALRPEDRV